MRGSDLRDAREKLRMSQIEFKEALNTALGRAYDKSRVSRWENDRESVPVDVRKAVNLMLEQRASDAKIIAFANQKGGVGKTTSAMNIASALRKNGARVLMIDLDPQASASDWLLGRQALSCHREGRSIYHALLKGRPLPDCIVESNVEASGTPLAFDIIPSHIDLSEADGRREPGFEHALAEALDQVRNNYDFIVIDAPPNLGLMTYMALVAADSVLIPVQTEPPDAMGVALLLDTVQKVQRRLNPHLRIAGILPTRYNGRQAVDREVLHHLIQYTADRAIVLEPVSDSAVFGNAAWGGTVAVDASPRAKAVGPYLRIANALALGQTPPLALLNLGEDTAGE
ncbi:AAA family ATPase [Kozakia baliensis]|uniref:Chromosome partitioning protein ParA n=1 Tax=Kozakia baliensis TaxID=153496 RepID=A0A1D8UYS5_9PROT|nr:AAA family ATPase [Kozakia baliensis]AOX18769.1 chromosome partitioning protein ParA [Kozakia baliensis]GBR32952.1 chromosome partitioning protein ParA/MinD/MRP/soj [Kozakia baliensis NRIC 0488]GEL65459.1 hypothetical protein KBA01_27450 [Kozakia baliensis]